MFILQKFKLGWATGLCFHVWPFFYFCKQKSYGAITYPDRP